MAETKIMRPGEYAAEQDKLAQEALVMDDKKEPEIEKKDERTSGERWLDNVKSVGLTEDEANKILDQLLEQGYWEKNYVLFRGKLQVTFRTRNAFSNQRVAAAVDGLRNPTDKTYDQVLLRQQLAGSLSKYQGKPLNHPGPKASNEEHDKAHTEALDFIDKVIPEHVVGTLYQQLFKFDLLVRAVLSEGATEGF